MKQLITSWGAALDRSAPLPEYPRPQLRRANWQSLNGPWDYAITKTAAEPEAFSGQIIVPFSPESPLSGVNRQLQPGETLWYRRTITLPWHTPGQHVLLHFGAVDQFCRVFVDRKLVGEHLGGYWPFTLELAIDRETVTLIVAVQDRSDQGLEAYGKQKLDRGHIWYTAQSGIWQTVWLEVTPAVYITDLTITPQLADRRVKVAVKLNRPGHAALTVRVLAEGTVVASATTDRADLTLALPDPRPWSPDDPFLYDLELTAGDDRVTSYFGMRSFTRGRDAHGHAAFLLNGAPVFQTGVLDQGYWSDGLYTAPSDEAVVAELTALKDMGFNMLRKHAKIEPLRWYYHCDRLGLLVWQDMVSGGGPYRDLIIRQLPFVGVSLDDHDYARLGRGDVRSRTRYLAELDATVALLKNAVGLCTWVPFNEGWGQFDALRTAARVRKLDRTRLLDHASGWYDQGGGDFKSTHRYYKPYRIKPDAHGRIQALTEFGGYTLAVADHTATTAPYGYKQFKDAAGLTKALQALYRTKVLANLDSGLAVAIYTQVSDVEDECNGLWTYDRAQLKVAPSVFQAINAELKRRYNHG
ncbi:glycoside hydrolase family 2 protein [Lacticaseibacillus kribbianus]|uniref:glycoside hydrolase family 2 protein n=1 Tax=Lacticaseibacillus kribbianus TaxID=2926292 RepID=UPI001CD515D4|nr:sugar-binding domain-containing protein [Lacticaseibacillus kribbianus]